MNATQEACISHYLGKGLSKDVSVGLVAVLCAESALNPGSQGVQASENGGVLNPHGAYGVASWNGPRQAALQAFATRTGKDVTSLFTQLDFVLTEAANAYPSVWKAITSPTTTFADMVTVMVDGYEIPADKPAEIGRALVFAKDFYGETIAPATSAPPPAVVVPDPKMVQIVAQLVSAVMQVLASNGVAV